MAFILIIFLFSASSNSSTFSVWSSSASIIFLFYFYYLFLKTNNENNNNILINKISYNKISYNEIIISYDTFINKQKKSINSVIIDNKQLNQIIELFTIKSKEWEYEDEYRILFYDEENKNPNGRSIDLPIKSICFGVQTSKEDKELVYNIVNSINEKRLDYNNDIIKLYQAELDDNELFKINIKPYKHGKIKE
ncbi:DUF2971 domain-containing protein [Brachyspira sp.]|uniref:DUF2971 domain-containing protein n=1 Tax=Brachyspira sp. TaxID=1977261 RepID=UPI00261CC02E|nr:DUF2971 domain-containing protein [Brachyspira sp.]